jgi:LacI family transcriptional regulator
MPPVVFTARVVDMPRTIAIALELSHPFQWHHDIYVGTQQYARECGDWRCVIDEFPEEVLRRSRKGRPAYDGIIARVTRAMFRAAKRKSLPVVNVWLAGPEQSCPRVGVDHAAVGRLAADHLMARSFQRFGFVQFADTRNGDLERDGFVARLAEQEFSCSTLFLPVRELDTAAIWIDMQERMRAWLSDMRPPFGLYVTEGRVARQLVHMCEEYGWQVPQDVAIISGEDEPNICNDPAPSLTSVNCNWRRVGYEAAALLDRMMKGEPAAATVTLTPPIGMVPRASTDFHAVEDATVAQALRYISERLHRRLDTDVVADAIAVSPRTLRRRFQEHLGRPLTAEIRRLRIELVKRMLQDPDRNIAEIARLTGFSNSSQLWAVFQREVGCGPREYRKEFLGGPK